MAAMAIGAPRGLPRGVPRLDRTVATSERRERFEREAEAVAALSHPHICPVFDVGHQDGIDFLAMEHLEGSRPWIWAMFGWFSDASTLASRSKRARRSASAAKASGKTLMATSRSSVVSRARYTSPMPPALGTRERHDCFTCVSHVCYD